MELDSRIINVDSADYKFDEKSGIQLNSVIGISLLFSIQAFLYWTYTFIHSREKSPCVVASAKEDTAQHWPSIAKNLPKIGCQYRAVVKMITSIWTWRSILVRTLAANTCFRHSNGPMLSRTLVFSLP